jgi:hypothetical protein
VRAAASTRGFICEECKQRQQQAGPRHTCAQCPNTTGRDTSSFRMSKRVAGDAPVTLCSRLSKARIQAGMRPRAGTISTGLLGSAAQYAGGRGFAIAVGA